jgi:hypothetical protein
MAMSKKEAEYVEQLKARLALRHTSPVNYDIDPETVGDTETFGFTRGHIRVEWHRPNRGVTTKSGHGSRAGIETMPKLSSQKGIPLHSTRQDALRHMRYELEQQAAAALRAIDLEILKEDENPTDPYHLELPQWR